MRLIISSIGDFARITDQQRDTLTHVTIRGTVPSVVEEAFMTFPMLSTVFLEDGIQRLEGAAFSHCRRLEYVRLPRTLTYVGPWSFCECTSLEFLVIPSSVGEICSFAFLQCRRLRHLLPPPNSIPNFDQDHLRIIQACGGLLNDADVAYERAGIDDNNNGVTPESNNQVNQWLMNRRNQYPPLHVACFNASVEAQNITDVIREHGAASALRTVAGNMTALHFLAINPHAGGDAFTACLSANKLAAISNDDRGKNPLEYAREYNIVGLIRMIEHLCLGTP